MVQRSDSPPVRTCGQGDVKSVRVLPSRKPTIYTDIVMRNPHDQNALVELYNTAIEAQDIQTSLLAADRLVMLFPRDQPRERSIWCFRAANARQLLGQQTRNYRLRQKYFLRAIELIEESMDLHSSQGSPNRRMGLALSLTRLLQLTGQDEKARLFMRDILEFAQTHALRVPEWVHEELANTTE